MKEVVITNKVVGRGSAGTTSPASSVNLSAYALKSDLLSFEKTFNDFLQGEDTDNVINRWNELEAFLNGIGEDFNLLSLLGDKADKLYVDSNFVTINTAQSILGEKDFMGGLKVNGSPIVYNSEKGYWKLEGDLLVTGGVSFYSSDTEYVPSTIMSALLLDDSTLGINSDGQLYVKGNLSGGASTLGELSNVGSWANSVADVDRIMYQAAGSSMWVAKSLSDLAVGGVSGDYLPLTGGLMGGAIQWGNTSSPVSINTSSGYLSLDSVGSEICIAGGNNSYVVVNYRKSAYGYAPASWYFRAGSATSYANIYAGNLYSNGNSVIHSGNYSSYALPLSGGTIDGVLTLRASDSSSDSWIAFSNKSDSVVHKLGIRRPESIFGFQYYNGSEYYNVWHSGNDGSGSGLDADLLDGKHNGELTSIYLASSDDTSTLGVMQFRAGAFASGDTVNKSWCVPGSSTQWGEVVRMVFNSGVYYHDLFFDANSSKIAYRSISNGSSPWGWKYIAFTDSNVASATKLQTARTIWGQSFDGTGNVTGVLITNEYVSFNRNNTELGYVGFATNSNNNIYLSSSGDLLINGVGKTIINNSGGNVGIGTTSPSEKLHVNGTARINSMLIVDGVYLGKADILIDKQGRRWRIGTGAGDGSNSFNFMDDTGSSIKMKLDISGNLLVYGGITMYSDQRKKTILNNVELSLSQIANAPLVEHFYNSDDKRTTHVGSIAQYWAGINDWFCKLDNEGYYTMEIQNCALASAISIARELSRYENKTDKTIKQLKKRICQLEDEIERLKSA